MDHNWWTTFPFGFSYATLLADSLLWNSCGTLSLGETRLIRFYCLIDSWSIHFKSFKKHPIEESG